MNTVPADCCTTRMANSQSSLLLFFIDGLGIGTRGPQNPFDGLVEAEPLAIFQHEPPQIPFNGILTATDACLGVPGRGDERPPPHHNSTYTPRDHRPGS